MLTEPENDPELAQYGIEFLQKAMTKRPDVFMQLQPTSSLEFVFMFSIKMLNGNPMLKRLRWSRHEHPFSILRYFRSWQAQVCRRACSSLFF